MKMPINYTLSWAALILIALFVTGCAHPVPLDPAVTAEPAGFLQGLLHGVILLFTFIISLFKDDVAVYAANNAGGWYDFGYLLGIMIFFGGGGNRSRR